MNAISLVDLLEENYRLLEKSRAKWLDKQVKYLLARIFTGKGKTLDIKTFNWLEKALAHKAGMFTSLTKTSRLTLAGLMLSNDIDPIDGIEELFFNKQLLQEQGFKSSSALYFSAYQLFFTEVSSREEVCQRARHLYREMKQGHPVLINSTAYSMVVSLAQSNNLSQMTVEEIVSLVEDYFVALNDMGVKNRDRCLQVAALATSLCGEKNQTLLQKIDYYQTVLQEEGLKIKGISFGSLLSLLYFSPDQVILDLEELLFFIEDTSHHINLLFEKEYKHALALSLYSEMKGLEYSQKQATVLPVTFSQMIVQEQTLLAASTIDTLSNH